MAHFESPRFPDSISEGATGGPMFDSQVITMDSGVETRNQNWSQPRVAFDVAHGLKDQTQLDELIAFFRAIGKGKANSFRFKDWSDFQATHPFGLMGAAGQAGVFTLSGTGDGVPTRQLGKRYTAGATSDDRKITKLVNGQYTLYRNHPTVLVEGGGAGQYSLDQNTGIVTFVADAQSNANSITPGTTTQVVLASNPGTLVIGNKLYLSGFAGANAASVNNLAHSITNITGSGPFTFTLSTNTNGQTITLGSGIGRKFPQTTDLLTATFQFDIPCRFDTDSMKVDIEHFNVYTWGQIPVIEVR